MATFLEICQDVNDLSGAQGTLTSVSATGYQGKLVRLVKKAWTDIQSIRSDWMFLKENVTINTTQGKTDYSITDILGIGADDTIGHWRLILDADLAQLREYSEDAYLLDGIINLDQDKPTLYTHESSTQLLKINPPDGVYSLDAHYYRKPQILVNNTDVPLSPSEFHDVITYKTLADLGLTLVGDENLYNGYVTQYNYLLAKLLQSQSPSKRLKLKGGIA